MGTLKSWELSKAHFRIIGFHENPTLRDQGPIGAGVEDRNMRKHDSMMMNYQTYGNQLHGSNICFHMEYVCIYIYIYMYQLSKYTELKLGGNTLNCQTTKK